MNQEKIIEVKEENIGQLINLPQVQSVIKYYKGDILHWAVKVFPEVLIENKALINYLFEQDKLVIYTDGSCEVIRRYDN